MSDWRKQAESFTSDMDKNTDTRAKAATTTHLRYQTPEGIAKREELSKKLKEQYKDPARIEKQRKAMQSRDNSTAKDAAKKRESNPEFVKKRAEASRSKNKEITQTAEWKEANAKKYDDPAFWDAYYEGIKKRDANPEQRAKIKAGTRKAVAKRCKTPLGVFECIQDAADAHQMGYNTVSHRLKSPTFPDWSRLDD